MPASLGLRPSFGKRAHFLCSMVPIDLGISTQVQAFLGETCFKGKIRECPKEDTCGLNWGHGKRGGGRGSAWPWWREGPVEACFPESLQTKLWGFLRVLVFSSTVILGHLPFSHPLPLGCTPCALGSQVGHSEPPWGEVCHGEVSLHARLYCMYSQGARGYIQQVLNRSSPKKLPHTRPTSRTKSSNNLPSFLKELSPKSAQERLEQK